jgi:hypothetical protein
MMAKAKTTTEALRKMFVIEADNAITGRPADEVLEGAIVFSNQAELAAVSSNYPAQKLVDIWNRLPGVSTLNKFASRQTAVRRIWAVVGEPNHSLVQAREGKHPAKPAESKRDRIIALLRRPEGATLKAIMTTTGWQAHSVRGFISGQLTKKSHFKVKSFQRNGERVYRIRS